MRKIVSSLLALAVAGGLSLTATNYASAAANSATGPIGQTLTVDSASNVDDMQRLIVTGRGYDLKVGIYVTFCVIPPKGKRPELCGPFDVTGQTIRPFGFHRIHQFMLSRWSNRSTQ